MSEEINDLNQFFNGLTREIGRIADETQKLLFIDTDLKNINNTIQITNYLLFTLILIQIIAIIIKWMKK